MNKGDTLYLELNYTIDGQPLVKDAYQQMELWVADKKLTLNNGIKWDNDIGKYIATVSSYQSLSLPSLVKCQLRVFINNQWISSEIATFGLGGALCQR